jgi:phenylalanyl-tRNA synthetase beta subunit
MVYSSNFSKQKITYLWNLQTCENLINLRAQYQNNFKYARNSDYAGLWERLAININEINHNQISAIQCQNK